MEFKQLVRQFTYRIEPQAGGGFIAHCSDPAAPALEAPTREELQQKIQAKIVSQLSTAFPGIKLPQQSHELKLGFHVEKNPEGGFTIHSADPGALPGEAANEKEVHSHIAERLINFAGKHLPELSQAISAQSGALNIQVTVKKTGFTRSEGLDQLKAKQGTETMPATSLPDYGSAMVRDGEFQGTLASKLDVARGSIDNAPITPEPSSGWGFIRLLLALVVIGAIAYFFFHQP